MTRKRVWEIGSTAALLLAVAVAVGGFVAWRERQRRLERELVMLLNQPVPTRHNAARMFSLSRQGASVHVRSAGGWTVLMTAAATNDLPLLREALAQGADVNEVSDDGWTALLAAGYWGSVESAQLLLSNGADLHYRDRDGNSALSIAVGCPAMIRLLKQHGAKE